MGDSFLDELLGRAAVEIGAEELRRRVRLENASDAVRERAGVVIRQRTGEHHRGGGD